LTTISIVGAVPSSRFLIFWIGDGRGTEVGRSRGHDDRVGTLGGAQNSVAQLGRGLDRDQIDARGSWADATLAAMSVT
jgi:hypothetical protein